MAAAMAAAMAARPQRPSCCWTARPFVVGEKSVARNHALPSAEGSAVSSAP